MVQLISVLILIPLNVISISLTVRRLHDINLNGWLCLIGLVPIVDLLWALYVIFKEGTIGPNNYGEDPKGRGVAAA